jgi:hypothetical protein
MFFYLEWPDAISRCTWQQVWIRFCANLGKGATKALAIIIQRFGENSMSRTWKIQTHRDRKRRDMRTAKSRACSSFSLTWKGLFTNNFVLTGRTVKSTHYCDALRQLRENVLRLRTELWRQKNCLLQLDNAPPHISFFTREFFPKSHDYRHTHSLTLFPRLEIQPKDRNFDTMKVIEAESQMVLNAKQNTNSRIHLKSGRSAGNGAYVRKGSISRVMVASRSKVSFWPDGSTSPGN